MKHKLALILRHWADRLDGPATRASDFRFEGNRLYPSTAAGISFALHEQKRRYH